VADPEDVGVPLITPEVEIPSPSGSDPEVIDQV
jgi:hypothetical protein